MWLMKRGKKQLYTSGNCDLLSQRKLEGLVTWILIKDHKDKGGGTDNMNMNTTEEGREWVKIIKLWANVFLKKDSRLH